MTINLEYETSNQLGFDYDTLVKKVVEACLDYEDCPYEAAKNPGPHN